MKKILIEKGDLESYICQANGTIYVDETMILTPGAKDALSEQKISIVREAGLGGKCDKDAGCPAGGCKAETENADIDPMLLGVAAILKNDYGVSDPEQLRETTCRIVETLKKTI
ncbi:hypothetical protein [Desulfosediminicola sp.]|uniref:hypothetical protein n=1 Tax=Desulfosediminicola sp. TaxID=2886825 RepID=UPI003AF2FEB0